MQPDPVLSFFAKYIERELGIVYSEQNYFQLQSRLEEIAKFMGVSSVLQLHEIARKEIAGSFRQLLLDVATNNETSFFRDIKVFRVIEKLLLADSHRLLRANEKLRVWSAAASTGQEALSMAMLLNEFNSRERQNIQMNLIATDVSERALEKCRKRVYTQLEVQRGLPASYLIRYFTKVGEDSWLASSDLYAHLRFENHNLLKEFAFLQRFHLILCRNMLIYQSVETKKEIVRRLSMALEPGGFLILGAGESLMGLSSDFQQHMYEGALIYQKPRVDERAA